VNGLIITDKDLALPTKFRFGGTFRLKNNS